jgi:spore germination protein GerM
MRAAVLHRDLPVTEAIGRATLEAWLKGPTPRERNLGFVGLVPDGAELLDLSIEDGLAVVDLSSEFEHAPLGSTGEGMLLAQLAGTITQFPRVDRGLLKIEGRFKDHYLGHGFLIDERHPLVKPPSESFYYACR